MSEQDHDPLLMAECECGRLIRRRASQVAQSGDRDITPCKCGKWLHWFIQTDGGEVLYARLPGAVLYHGGDR